jgi:hypothetical protein
MILSGDSCISIAGRDETDICYANLPWEALGSRFDSFSPSSSSYYRSRNDLHRMKPIKDLFWECVNDVQDYAISVYYSAQTYPLVYVAYGITVGTLCGVSAYWSYKLRRSQQEFAKMYAEMLKRTKPTPTSPTNETPKELQRQQLEEKRQFPDVKLPGS